MLVNLQLTDLMKAIFPHGRDHLLIMLLWKVCISVAGLITAVL